MRRRATVPSTVMAIITVFCFCGMAFKESGDKKTMGASVLLLTIQPGVIQYAEKVDANVTKR